jgi:hypothetical protein
MATHPRWLERIGEALIPPASAEHALGDLAECSRSPSEYLRNLASIVPRLVWCQIRRRATIGGIVFNALLSGVTLVAAQRIGGGTFLNEPAELARLALCWATWVTGCALAAAYGPPEKPLTWNSRIFAAAVLVALAAGGSLGVPLVRLAAGLGVTFGISFLLAMPIATAGMPPPLSAQTLADHARLFQRGIRWRNAREQVIAAVLIVLTVPKLGSATGADLWAQRLLIGAMAFIIAFLFLKAGPRRVPDTRDLRILREFHRRELARQRDVLRSVPLWYLLPFVPGFLAASLSQWETRGPGALLALPVLALIFAGIWALNRKGARWLDSQVHAVDALPVPDAEQPGH